MLVHQMKQLLMNCGYKRPGQSSTLLCGHSRRNRVPAAHLAQGGALGSTQPAAQLAQLCFQPPHAPLLLRLHLVSAEQRCEVQQMRSTRGSLHAQARQPAAGGGSRGGARTSWSVATCRRRRSSSASCPSWLLSLGLLTLAAAAWAACTASRRAQAATRRTGEPASPSRPSTLSLEVDPPGEGGMVL